MEALIQELIEKMYKLNPGYSKTDEYTTKSVMRHIQKRYEDHNLDPLIEVIGDYYKPIVSDLTQKLQSYKFKDDLIIEAIGVLFQDLDKILREFVSEHGSKNFDIEKLLVHFHNESLKNEYFHTLEKYRPGIIEELKAILNLEESKNNKMKKQQLISQIYYDYNRTPSGDLMHESDDFYIFLKQCIWIVDGLSRADEGKQSQLLEAMSVDSETLINENELMPMLIEWLGCPALIEHSDMAFIFNDENITLRAAINKIVADIEKNGITLYVISCLHNISDVYGVAMGVDLAEGLDKLKISQDNNLRLLLTIIRLVNKVHEESDTALPLKSGEIAEIFGIPNTQDDFVNFARSLNIVESAILEALEHNISFKNIDLSNNPNKNKM